MATSQDRLASHPSPAPYARLVGSVLFAASLTGCEEPTDPLPSGDTEPDATASMGDSTDDAPSTAGSTGGDDAGTEGETGESTADDDSGSEGSGGEPSWPAHCPGEAPAFPIGTAVWVGGGGVDGRTGVTLDGLEWQDSTTVSLGPIDEGHTRNLIRGVGYGDGVFVVVGGYDNAYVSTSCDGVSWHRDVLGTNIEGDIPPEYGSFLSDVAFDDGVFVAAGGAGSRMRSDDQGQTWQETGTYFDGHLRGIAAGDGRFVAAGHTWGGGQGITTTSVDGQSWTPMASSAGELWSIAFGAGTFVAAGPQRCARSTDGESWDPCGLPPVGADITGIQFSLDRFYLQTLDGQWTSSPDGESWEPMQPGWLPDRFAWGEDRHVMVRWGARGFGLPPQRWTEVEFPPEEGLGDLVFGHVADPA